MLVQLQQILAVVIWIAILNVLIDRFRKEKKHLPITSWIVIAGVPLYLVVCWFGMLEARSEDAVFWGRLMSGPPSSVFALSTACCIVGTCLVLVGWCWDGLSHNLSSNRHWLAAIGPAGIWWVIWKHPVPHYVPLQEWQDDLVWAALLAGTVVGTAIAPKVLPWIVKLSTVFFWLGCLAVFVLGIPGTLVSQVLAHRPVELQPLTARERFVALGCLSCHTIADESGKPVGYPEPGEALEGGCARIRPDLLEFLLDPTKETAERLGIRSEATGLMAGVKLTPEQAELLIDSLNEFCDQPISDRIPMPDNVKAIFQQRFCLSCHSLFEEGMKSGPGGPLDNSGHLGAEKLDAWFKEPTAAKAVELGIREKGTGSMAFLILTDDERKAMVEYLVGMYRPGTSESSAETSQADAAKPTPASETSQAVDAPLRFAVEPQAIDNAFYERTDNPLNVAIAGPNGFFVVLLEDGSKGYTRCGEFQLNAERALVTADGFILQPKMVVPEGAQAIEIATNGKVVVDGTSLGAIELASFEHPDKLEAVNETVFRETADSGRATLYLPGEEHIGGLLHGYVEKKKVQ